MCVLQSRPGIDFEAVEMPLPLHDHPLPRHFQQQPALKPRPSMPSRMRPPDLKPHPTFSVPPPVRCRAIVSQPQDSCAKGRRHSLPLAIKLAVVNIRMRLMSSPSYQLHGNLSECSGNVSFQPVRSPRRKSAQRGYGTILRVLTRRLLEAAQGPKGKDRA